jgi:NADPH2:quinone reductase
VSITFGTAIPGLKDRGRLRAGETVAVLGAAGGAGLAAVEIAKLMGARVIAVASTPEKLEVLRMALTSSPTTQAATKEQHVR